MAKLVQTVRIFDTPLRSGGTPPVETRSEDILINLDLLKSATPKDFYDNAEGGTFAGTYVTFIDGSTMLIGSTLAFLMKAAEK